MTKKQILLFASIVLVLTYFTTFTRDFCYRAYEEGPRVICSGDVAGIFFLFSLLILIFSFLTYKMHEKVFRPWLHFAYWWVPLSIVLSLLAGGGSGGGFGMPNLLDQESVAFIFAALFSIISLIIIIRKHFATRHGK